MYRKHNEIESRAAGNRLIEKREYKALSPELKNQFDGIHQQEIQLRRAQNTNDTTRAKQIETEIIPQKQQFLANLQQYIAQLQDLSQHPENIVIREERPRSDSGNQFDRTTSGLLASMGSPGHASKASQSHLEMKRKRELMKVNQKLRALSDMPQQVEQDIASHQAANQNESTWVPAQPRRDTAARPPQVFQQSANSPPRFVLTNAQLRFINTAKPPKEQASQRPGRAQSAPENTRPNQGRPLPQPTGEKLPPRQPIEKEMQPPQEQAPPRPVRAQSAPETTRPNQGRPLPQPTGERLPPRQPKANSPHSQANSTQTRPDNPAAPQAETQPAPMVGANKPNAVVVHQVAEQNQWTVERYDDRSNNWHIDASNEGSQPQPMTVNIAADNCVTVCCKDQAASAKMAAGLVDNMADVTAEIVGGTNREKWDLFKQATDAGFVISNINLDQLGREGDLNLSTRVIEEYKGKQANLIQQYQTPQARA